MFESAVFSLKKSRNKSKEKVLHRSVKTRAVLPEAEASKAALLATTSCSRSEKEEGYRSEKGKLALK